MNHELVLSIYQLWSLVFIFKLKKPNPKQIKKTLHKNNRVDFPVSSSISSIVDSVVAKASFTILPSSCYTIYCDSWEGKISKSCFQWTKCHFVATVSDHITCWEESLYEDLQEEPSGAARVKVWTWNQHYVLKKQKAREAGVGDKDEHDRKWRKGGWQHSNTIMCCRPL